MASPLESHFNDPFIRSVCELEAERDRLREALERIANPNWQARPTGQDARDMAAFAREALSRPENERG